MRLFVYRLVCVMFATSNALVASAQQPAKWRLVEEWRKGGAAEGAYHFDNVHFAQDLQAVPGGRLVVLDRQVSQLYLLDSAGKVVRAFSRMGSGPGELRGAIGIAVAPNGQLLVNDPSNGRFSLYSPKGDFLRTITVSRIHPFYFIEAWDGAFDRAGHLRESVGIRAAPSKRGAVAPAMPMLDSSIATERWTPDFARSDSAVLCGAPPHVDKDHAKHYRVESRAKDKLEDGTASGSVGWLNVPFTEQANVFVRDRDGYEWSASTTGAGELVRRESGRCTTVLARVTLRGPRAPIPRVLRDSALRRVPSEFRSRVPREYAWFRSLRVDDHNRLWVEREVAGGGRFDVFTSGGAPVAEIDVPRGMRATLPIVIANDHVYGFVKNDDDVPYLVAWRIVR